MGARLSVCLKLYGRICSLVSQKRRATSRILSCETPLFFAACGRGCAIQLGKEFAPRRLSEWRLSVKKSARVGKEGQNTQTRLPKRNKICCDLIPSASKIETLAARDGSSWCGPRHFHDGEHFAKAGSTVSVACARTLVLYQHQRRQPEAECAHAHTSETHTRSPQSTHSFQHRPATTDDTHEALFESQRPGSHHNQAMDSGSCLISLLQDRTHTHTHTIKASAFEPNHSRRR